jgi:hypothetical protein
MASVPVPLAKKSGDERHVSIHPHSPPSRRRCKLPSNSSSYCPVMLLRPHTTGFRRTARCARYNRAAAFPAVGSSCEGARSAPRSIPPARAFSPWTRPDRAALLDVRRGRLHQSLDPRPGDASAPGPLTRGRSCPLTLTRGLAPSTRAGTVPFPAPWPNRAPVGCAPCWEPPA